MISQSRRFSCPGLRVFVLLGLLVFARASWAEDLGWWPDPNVRSGLGLWVSYSRDYEMYQDRSFVDQQVADMQRVGIDVVFVAISNAAATPHLPKLSDKTDPFTMDVQYLLNQLDLAGIRASAALFSDAFTGSDSQMARFVQSKS